jgi:hypothetical protein
MYWERFQQALQWLATMARPAQSINRICQLASSRFCMLSRKRAKINKKQIKKTAKAVFLI